MARKTHKHKEDRIYWDTPEKSWDATIYTSGGVTFTVYVESLDDNGRTEGYDKTFTGDNARQRAYDWAYKQLSNRDEVTR